MASFNHHGIYDNLLSFIEITRPEVVIAWWWHGRGMACPLQRVVRRDS
jgi:hypothetical protein